MRLSPAPLVLLSVCLLTGFEAKAQYANKSLGASLGYLRMTADPHIEWGAPLALEASLYIENGFDLTARGALMLLTDTSSAQAQQLFGLSPAVGIRYLLSEEWVRPYIGLELAYLHIFKRAQQENFVGLGPYLGVDFFINDAWSIGPRGFANFYVMLNTPMSIGVGGQLVVLSYF